MRASHGLTDLDLAEALGAVRFPRAQCHGKAALFDEPDERGTAEHVDAARALCAQCPHMAECLALRNRYGDKPGGVWGGQLFLFGWRDPVARHRCTICAAPLSLGRLRQQAATCSEECVRELDRRKKREKWKSAAKVTRPPMIKWCLWCGAEFVGSRRLKNYCCSGHAEAMAKWRHRKAAREAYRRARGQACA